MTSEIGTKKSESQSFAKHLLIININDNFRLDFLNKYFIMCFCLVSFKYLLHFTFHI